VQIEAASASMQGAFFVM